MNVAIIGLGLIGGSMALIMKEKGIARKVVGVDAAENHRLTALSLGIVDEITDIETAMVISDVIVVAIPVNATADLLPLLLDKVNRQVVMDVGSTKSGIFESIKTHPNKSRFVGTHPMWGTEYSGPEAATSTAFAGKAVVICNKEEADADALMVVENLYKAMGMHLVYMPAVSHDVHVAYVSHIAHITSFALANTVLEKEKQEDAIFELASGGFESTVRLAKSHPDTWTSIFLQNKDNVLDVLQEHIVQLEKFKHYLLQENEGQLRQWISNANTIKKILK